MGYEEGGQLTEKVRRRPYSVVRLDEIEKAHPDIFNQLLQVLDDGQLTDGLGRKVDFRNTIIILTSNIGSRQLKDFGTGVGFNTAAKRNATETESNSILQNALKKTFSPEFLNRVDDVIMFNALDKPEILKIIDLVLDNVYRRMLDLGFELSLTDAARDFLIEKGFDPQFGARPLKRAVQKYVEDVVAEKVISGGLKEGDKIQLDYDPEDGMRVVVPKKVKKAKDTASE